MPSLDEIRDALRRHDAKVLDAEGKRQAAVAMLLRESAEGSEVLFIERAERAGDPWSGHMAFPGGRVDPQDPHAQGAAERETHEEVGIELSAAEPLGRLDDKQGNPVTHPALVISAWVYAVSDPVALRLNYEVREAFWFPVRDLLDPERHVPHTIESRSLDFPGILVGEPERHVVWGLTYSFLESFFTVVGRPLPNRWSEELRRYHRHIER